MVFIVLNIFNFSGPIQLLQIGPILVQQFYKTFLCKTPRDYAEVFAPRMYNFGWGYPVPVFMFVVILVYSTIAPLILVFGVIYFAMTYLVCKYQLLYGKLICVYAEKKNTCLYDFN